MIMKSQILKYLHYNIWANQVLIDYLAKISDTEIEQKIVSSFPSIRQTVLHIWDAQVLWRLRFDGISGEFPSKNFHGSNQEMYDNLMASSKAFVDLAKNENDAFFEEKHTFMTISYGATSQRACDMLHHCMNHSTYHRGQVIMMLRQLGYSDLPHLDFMLYLMQLNATN